MTMKRDLITRTCSNCGLEKPISAFLQVSGAHGTIYGHICGTCRGAGAKEKPDTAADDESSTSPMGLRIGHKEQVFSTLEQIRKLKSVKEIHLKEIKKREDLSKERTRVSDAKEQTDKDYRKVYLEAKQKQGFLSKPTPPPPPPTPPAAAGETKQFMDRLSSDNPEINPLMEAKQREKIELNVSQQQPQFGDNKTQTEAFKNFLLWLGPTAPAMRFYANVLNQPQAKSAAGEKKGIDRVIEVAERNWGPSSHKR
jgi:hypothetical protein